MSKQNQWRAEAPSNIALVKYMGKVSEAETLNQPVNRSLSFTLDHLKSEVLVTLKSQGTQDTWAPWPDSSLSSTLKLSSKGQEKFLNHWKRCRQTLAPHFNSYFELNSCNHFPSDCGIASSASSFAALTMAAYNTFKHLGALETDLNLEELALLSQRGSGSSCRSFFSPFVIWNGSHVYPITSVYKQLCHAVVLVSGEKKKVSSSEAHLRVPSSKLFSDRRERANQRVAAVEFALRDESQWAMLFENTWADFWDMHVLFETSAPPFSYMTPESLFVLRFIQDQWESKGDGPLVTMDAGANVHLLYRPEQLSQAQTHQEFLKTKFKLLTNY